VIVLGYMTICGYKTNHHIFSGKWEVWGGGFPMPKVSEESAKLNGGSKPPSPKN